MAHALVKVFFIFIFVRSSIIFGIARAIWQSICHSDAKSIRSSYAGRTQVNHPQNRTINLKVIYGGKSC